jgi:lipopolysaccharide transport system permease protein
MNPQSQPDPISSDAGRSADAAAEAAVNVIAPKSGWMPIDFGEMWHYRELLYFLIWRDIKVRYKQTVLGAAWAILQPLLSMAIFSVIFGAFAKIPSDGAAYPLFVFAALVPWTFFANAVAGAANSLITQTSILTKVYFPRLFVPTASIGVAMVDFFLSFLVYAAMMVVYAQWPGWSMLMVAPLVLVTVLAAAGVGYFLGSVTVAYRDFRHIVPFLLQVWLYASPVVYSISLVPQKYRWIMAINPMGGIIAAFRSALLNQPMDWPLLGVSSAVAVGLFFLGLYNFRRTERRIADII